MKKNLLLLTFGLLMLLVSCNKDNNQMVVGNDAIMGTWQRYAFEYFQNTGESQVTLESEMVGTGCQILVFNANNAGYKVERYIGGDGENIVDTVYFMYSLGEERINLSITNADGSVDNTHYYDLLDLTENNLSVIPHPQEFVPANSDVTEIGYRFEKQ